jgi:DNA-binding NarL/FixJ family response regulator
MLKTLSKRYDVVHATRVSSALRELESACFDVVLTDLTLPDAVRLECVDNVRQAYPELPLVVLTLLDWRPKRCKRELRTSS